MTSKKLIQNDFSRKLILTPIKIPKNEGDLGKIVVATGFEKLPKVQQIAQSGHTAVSTYLRMRRKMDNFYRQSVMLKFSNLKEGDSYWSTFKQPIKSSSLS